MRPALLAVPFIAPLSVPPATAQGYETVQTREAFLAAVEGRELSIWLLGVQLRVHADGTISGEARNDPVTGTWSWENGEFCREMAWGDMAIEPACQLVEVSGTRIRFTLDGGTGDNATFTIQ